MNQEHIQHTVLHRADVGFAVTDSAGTLRWVNPALAALLGLTPHRAPGRRLHALLPGLPETPDTDALTLLAPTSDDDRHRWLEVACSSLPRGELLYRAVDVTAWRNRELAATQQTDTMRRAQLTGHTGTWEWTVGSDTVHWSPHLAELAGTPGHTEVDVRAYYDLLHPDDRGMVRRVLDDALETGAAFTFVHRLFAADGSGERVLECYGEVATDPTGTPQRLFGTAHDISQVHQVHTELLRMADEDPLTGLPNRRALIRELERALADTHTGVLVLLDLDNFKDVNDLRGHAIGDRVMRTIARTLTAELTADAFLARLGGDEFAIVLRRTSHTDASTLAEHLGAAVADLRFLAGTATTRMTISSGVAAFHSGHDWETALANADLALHASKAAGRNRVTAYEPGHYTDTARRVTVLDRVRRALDHNGLALHAMPMVDLHTHDTLGHELLLRLNDGNTAAPGPGEFLPAAERTDLILDIDRWVLTHAIDTLAHHPDTPLHFHVNISGRTLDDPDFGNFVLQRLHDAAVPPTRLGVEITETAAVTNLDAARGLAEKLHTAGCRITLDDFGSGFGTFVHLKHLPVTGLKIDGEFVRDIDTTPSDTVLVRGIMEIARGLGLSAVAEWVERPAQLTTLATLGVPAAQGFHLGRPTPLDTLLQHT